LGRPVKLSPEDVKFSTAKRRQHRAGSRLRNQIEGKFGEGQIFCAVLERAGNTAFAGDKSCQRTFLFICGQY